MKHYIRTDPNTLDDNNNKLILFVWAQWQRAYLPKTADDFEIYDGPNRHMDVLPFDKCAWDGTNIVEYAPTTTEQNLAIAQKRLEEYKQRSDQKFIEWQFEFEQNPSTAESFRQVWLDEVNAIKTELPKV